MNLNQHISKTTFHQFVTVANRGIGIRNRPVSPLQLGVADSEQILKIARRIRRSQSSLALCNLDQLDITSPLSDLKRKEETSPWLKPIILVSNFQVFTDPQSFKKAKSVSPGKIPLFHLKVGKTPF